MIWGNTHKTIFFFLNLSIFLSRQGPGPSPSFWKRHSGRQISWQAEAGWLEVAVAREEATCCGLHWPSPGSPLSSLWFFRVRGRVVRQRQASWEIHLFQNKGTEITRQRNVLSAYSPWFGRLDKIPAAGSGQGEGAPGILSHRGCDFGRRGQADAYVQPILT